MAAMVVAIQLILGLKQPQLGRHARVIVGRLARGAGRLTGGIVLFAITALWHLMLGVASGIVRRREPKARRFTFRRL